MKKFFNIIMTIVLTLVICVIPFSSVLASQFTTNAVDKGSNTGSNSSIGIGDPIKPTDPTGTGLDAPVQKIIGAIRWAGYICAIAVLVYIGIKYIMASASEKADLKGALIKYVVGAVLIIFGTQIAAWLFSIGG